MAISTGCTAKLLHAPRASWQAGRASLALVGWVNPPGGDPNSCCLVRDKLLGNRHRLFQLLSIPLEEIVLAAPFLQTETQKHSKCQIDLVIQTKFNTLHICEVKFEKGPIGRRVIDEVQGRIDRLHTPRGFSVRPVLIHVNGVSDEVIEADYFSNIIDFSDLLNC